MRSKCGCGPANKAQQLEVILIAVPHTLGDWLALHARDDECIRGVVAAFRSVTACFASPVVSLIHFCFDGVYQRIYTVLEYCFPR